MREGHSTMRDGGNHEHSGNNSGNPPTDQQEPRFVAGPGFELAIRSTLAHPLEVEVKGGGEDPKKQSRNADSEHRHASLERRLESIEKAMLMMVEQMRHLDENLSRLTGPRHEGNARD